MARLAGKVRMPMSAVGNRAARLAKHQAKAGGFTLIELMVVITLIAIATAGVSFALRDNEATLLDREAERLSVILETARVQSRSSGVALAWVALGEGFVIVKASDLADPAFKLSQLGARPWLAPNIAVQIQSGALEPAINANRADAVVTGALQLGAEPMIAPASVALSLGQRRLAVTTDGLRPFGVQAIDERVAP